MFKDSEREFMFRGLERNLFVESWRETWYSIGKTLLKIYWCVILTLGLGYNLFNGELQKSLSVMSNITFWIVVQNFFLLVIVISVYYGLTKIFPFLCWSWWLLFKKDTQASHPQVKNINLIPLKIKYFGLVFCLILIVNLPKLAMIEEKWFRLGTQNWFEGLYMSLFFGIVHCLVGIPIAAGLAITFAGLWFTHQYFIGGIELSALHHTTYNLVAVSILFIILILKHVADLIKLNLGETETPPS